jgi:hypothetical protein
MERATPRATLCITAVILAALGLAQCERERPAPEPPRAQTPAPVAAATELSRAEMIAALARAASAFAAGADPGAAAAVAGRTFRIRLPFGCAGPAANASAVGDGLARWRWADDRGSLILSAQPLDWSTSPLLTTPGATPDWDGVQGFWIARPWLSHDICPAPAAREPLASEETPTADSPLAPEEAAPIGPPVSSPQTMGLAAIRASDSSRLGRRDGEEHRFVVRGAGGPPIPSTQGYRLILGGRVGAFPGGRAVRCVAGSTEQRPTCLVAVELDVVAFEDATGARLSEWRPT